MLGYYFFSFLILFHAFSGHVVSAMDPPARNTRSQLQQASNSCVAEDNVTVPPPSALVLADDSAFSPVSSAGAHGLSEMPAVNDRIVPLLSSQPSTLTALPEASSGGLVVSVLASADSSRPAASNSVSYSFFPSSATSSLSGVNMESAPTVVRYQAPVTPLLEPLLREIRAFCDFLVQFASRLSLSESSNPSFTASDARPLLRDASVLMPRADTSVERRAGDSLVPLPSFPTTGATDVLLQSTAPVRVMPRPDGSASRPPRVNATMPTSVLGSRPFSLPSLAAPSLSVAPVQRDPFTSSSSGTIPARLPSASADDDSRSGRLRLERGMPAVPSIPFDVRTWVSDVSLFFRTFGIDTVRRQMLHIYSAFESFPDVLHDLVSSGHDNDPNGLINHVYLLYSRQPDASRERADFMVRGLPQQEHESIHQFSARFLRRATVLEFDDNDPCLALLFQDNLNARYRPLVQNHLSILRSVQPNLFLRPSLSSVARESVLAAERLWSVDPLQPRRASDVSTAGSAQPSS